MDTKVVIMQHSIFLFYAKYRLSCGLVLNPDPQNIDICV